MLLEDTKETLRTTISRMTPQYKNLLAGVGPQFIIDHLITRGHDQALPQSDSQNMRDGFKNLVDNRDEAIRFVAGLMGMT